MRFVPRCYLVEWQSRCLVVVEDGTIGSGSSLDVVSDRRHQDQEKTAPATTTPNTMAAAVPANIYISVRVFRGISSTIESNRIDLHSVDRPIPLDRHNREILPSRRR